MVCFVYLEIDLELNFVTLIQNCIETTLNWIELNYDTTFFYRAAL